LDVWEGENARRRVVDVEVVVVVVASSCTVTIANRRSDLNALCDDGGTERKKGEDGEDERGEEAG